MPEHFPQRDPSSGLRRAVEFPRTRTLLAALLASGVMIGSGCGSLSRLTNPQKLQRDLEKDPNYSIGSVKGPTERSLNQVTWNKKREDLLRDGDPETTAMLEAYDHAQALYDEGKFPEAEKAFSDIVKQRRGKYESFGSKFRKAWGSGDKITNDLYTNYGDPIEEDALFMLAESQCQQRHYPDAEETYKKLLTRYPSTRYLDPTTKRLFRIARYWLDFPDEVLSEVPVESEIKTASASTELGEIEKPTETQSAMSRVPVLPNMTDNSRPLFDTHGRGKQALRTIWLNDATGPLADDALMLAANHSLRTEDFVEAARLYTLLREQYPDSPHLKDAYLLGSHVTLASYQGPAYDGKSLETSRELKQEMLAIFPDLTADQRAELQEEVDRLKDAEIARIWDLVEFYEVKRMNPAVKLHCYQIINKYPDSKYADMAREALQKADQRDRAWENSIWNFNRQRTPPTLAAEAPPQQPPATEPVPQQNPSAAPSEPRELPQSAEKPGLLERWNPLKRTEKPPKLQRIEESPGAEKKTSPMPGRASL